MTPFKCTTLAAVLLGLASAASAQQRLTLDDAVARALERNHDIRIERDVVAAADARARGAYGEYDVQLQVELGFRHHRDPVTSLFSGAPEGKVAAAENGFLSNVALTKLFQSGATATTFTSVERLSSNSVFTLFTPAYVTSLGVDLRQPLLRSRAIDPARAALRITALDRERSSATLQRQVLDTVAAVEQAYWDLVSARRQLTIRRGSVQLAEHQRADTEVRVSARIIPASDVAQPIAEVERRRGDAFGTEERVARAERALKLLILDDLTDPWWSVELEPVDVPVPPIVRLDTARALADAGQYRPELAEARARVLSQDVRISLARDTIKPSVDLVASYVSRGLAGERNSGVVPFVPGVSTMPESLDGGIGSSLNALGRNRFPDATVGVSVEIPLGRRYARGQLAAAEAERRQTVTALDQIRQRIAIDVHNALTALETATSRIQAAHAGLRAAETQLRAEQDRFGVGATTNFFVLTRQTELADAQLTEIDAQTAYRRAVTEFGRATGTLLRDRSVQVE